MEGRQLMKRCSIGGCDRKHCARGMCKLHYYRKYYSGEIETQPVSRPLTERFWEKVNKTDTCWLWTGAISNGYGKINIDDTFMLVHRLSYEMAHGPIPDGFKVDHLCHNPACVNPTHLRSVTNKQNTENRSGLTKRNTSGVHGVSWDRARGQWRAQIAHNGRNIFIGRFVDIESAEAAAISRRNELFTHNDLDRAAS